MEFNQVLDELTTIMSDIIKFHKEKLMSKEELSSITYGQFHFIHHISMMDQPTVTKLAQATNLTKPTVTIAINKLIKSGHVRKIKSELDGRVYFLELTDKAKKIGEAEMNAFDDIIDRMQQKLSEEEYNTLEKTLRKLLD
ncbi:MarR family winged helix-turn-helix transcriptional regulator [Vallitalea okinawensis]|uniref:MarR family winged helix-turn-helix transcriptional regulator n=1 Tax=Vallitalea okinawensis TaxID=2078660 RepID=UPI000CFBA242|nr:MarR family winged helix-turn-helix transcriptional regulator [Vallitalea okinawensis]